MNSKEFYAKKLELLTAARINLGAAFDALDEITSLEKENGDVTYAEETYQLYTDNIGELFINISNEFGAVEAMVDLSNV